MGLFRRRQTETVAGRALVVPFQALIADGNANNRSPDSRAKTRLLLELVSCEPGASLRPGAQKLTAAVPNWVRLVLYSAGSNDELSPELPAEVHVPVRVISDGTIVRVDVDRVAEDLAPHRDAAVRAFKREEAPLADIRGMASLAADAVRAVKGPASAEPDEEEQRRRTANMLKHDLAGRPKRLQKVRASALQAGPMMVANVRSGSMSRDDFESWLRFQVTSGAIDEAEAQQWRTDAR